MFRSQPLSRGSPGQRLLASGLRQRRFSTCTRAFHLPEGAPDALSHLHLLTLADVDPGAVTDAVEQTQQSSGGGGPIDFLAKSFELALTAIDGVLEQAHIPYSYGFSIIILTLLVKVATFPLTKKQVESTVSMQALQPYVKELQSRYADDPQRLQTETARLYQQAQVNPLAGCLPLLATLPVFIGLYRALTLAASDGLLQEGFFFIPSLGGPATMEQQLAGQGLNWLFPFVDGAPPLGWVETLKYITLPVLLVASQYASLSLSSPQSDDPQVKQTQAILKYLPVFIGYFALCVPAGLSIYWLTNNVLSTGQQLYLKKVTQVQLPESLTQQKGGTVINATTSPADVTPGAAAAVQASAASKRSRKGETFRARQAVERMSTIQKNPRGKKKGAKFAARKAQESPGRKADVSPAAAAATAAGVAAATAAGTQEAPELVVEPVASGDAAPKKPTPTAAAGSANPPVIEATVQHSSSADEAAKSAKPTVNGEVDSPPSEEVAKAVAKENGGGEEQAAKPAEVVSKAVPRDASKPE